MTDNKQDLSNSLQNHIETFFAIKDKTQDFSKDIFSSENIGKYLHAYNNAFDYAKTSLDKSGEPYLSESIIREYKLDMKNFDYTADSFAALYKNSCKLYYTLNPVDTVDDIKYIYKSNIDTLKNLYSDYYQIERSIASTNILYAQPEKDTRLTISSAKEKVSCCSLFSSCRKKHTAGTSVSENEALLDNSAAKSASSAK